MVFFKEVKQSFGLETFRKNFVVVVDVVSNERKTWLYADSQIKSFVVLLITNSQMGVVRILKILGYSKLIKSYYKIFVMKQ